MHSHVWRFDRETLVQIGPVVDVLLVGDRPGAQPGTTRALIDTGADVSCIAPSLVTAMELRRVGPGKMGNADTDAYNLRIIFCGTTLPECRGTVLPLPRLDEAEDGAFRVILGRHFLASGTLTYDGDAGTVTWTFTSA